MIPNAAPPHDAAIDDNGHQHNAGMPVADEPQ
jgi:hypothetical protein